MLVAFPSYSGKVFSSFAVRNSVEWPVVERSKPIANEGAKEIPEEELIKTACSTKEAMSAKSLYKHQIQLIQPGKKPYANEGSVESGHSALPLLRQFGY